MKRDIYVVVARLVLLLRDPESYKKLLACRGTDAQILLDIVQDVSALLPNEMGSADQQAVIGSWLLYGR